MLTLVHNYVELDLVVRLYLGDLEIEIPTARCDIESLHDVPVVVEIDGKAGAGLGAVVKTTVFLADMADFQAMNEVYASHFGDHKPARAAVQAAALPKGALVEIEAVAIKE